VSGTPAKKLFKIQFEGPHGILKTYFSELGDAMTPYILPGWCPLWERDTDGSDVLFMLSPDLIAEYKELSKPLTTEAFYDPEPPYHLDAAFAKILKDPAEKAAYEETVRASKKAQAEKVAAFQAEMKAQAAKKK
jgi:hypothetical protein